MALIYISWGAKQPPQALVDKMLEKVKAFHIVRNPELHFGPGGLTPKASARTTITPAGTSEMPLRLHQQVRVGSSVHKRCSKACKRGGTFVKHNPQRNQRNGAVGRDPRCP